MIADKPGGRRRYETYALLIFMLTYLVHNLDRSVVHILLNPIRVEFGLNDTQLGFMSGLAFAISYGIVGIPLGYLIDRVKRTLLLGILVLTWSGLTFASGFAVSFLTLCIARIFVGMAEAGGTPAVLALISDTFDYKKRTTAVGIAYVGTPLGILIGLGVGGTIADLYGWRMAFLIVGLPGVVLAFLIMLTIREPKRGSTDKHVSESPGKALTLRQTGRFIREHPALLHTLIAATLASAVASIFAVWLPSYLIRHFEVSVGDVAPWLALSGGIFGIAGALISSRIADYFARESLARLALFLAFCIGMLCPFIILSLLGRTIVVAYIFNGLFGFFVPSYVACLHSLMLSLTSATARGLVMSISAVLMNLVGYGLGPSLAGVLSDVFASLGSSDPLRNALIVMSLLGMWAAGHVLWAAKILIAKKAARVTA